ncbi:MAG TPA: hypothetical protein VFV99_19495 [Kofleriaceae bacterium]|nr:hypothetical protein [Kofleriaceae bacterium]
MRAVSGAAFGILAFLISGADAAADGEATPMIGGSVVWSPSAEQPSGMIGLAVEAAWWSGRVGVAVEGSGRSYVDNDQPRAFVLGSSVRLRLFDGLWRSWVDARDVEVGIELQGILERWWYQRNEPELDPARYGVGLALRVRGGADDGSLRISESRFFIRVLAAPTVTDHAVARSMTPPAEEPRELMLLIGIGAAFGSSDPDYIERFRWHE